MEAADHAPTSTYWRIVWDSLRADHIPLRAAALSFQTLASLLPMLAILLVILSAPAFESQRTVILDKAAASLLPLPAQNRAGAEKETAARQAVEEARERLKAQTRELAGVISENLSQIGLFSLAILLFIAMFLYRTVELAFNAIWKAPSGRSALARLAAATAFIFWAPLVVAFSILITERVSAWPVVGPLLGFLFPAFLTGLLFSGVYLYIPNASVRARPALAGGFVAAAGWELTKLGFLCYVSSAIRASELYGSLSILPVMFVWIYLSWMVTLGGAELTYLLQNRHEFLARWREAQKRQGSGGGRMEEIPVPPVLALAVALEVAQSFQTRQAGLGVSQSELAEALGVERGLLALTLNRLCSGAILARVEKSDRAAADAIFVPARSPSQITLADVLAAAQGSAPALGRGRNWERAAALVNKLDLAIAQGMHRVPLSALLADAPATESGAGTDRTAGNEDISTN